jgi:hypothetical protein
MTDISSLSAADLTAAHIALLVASYGRPSDKVGHVAQSAPSKLSVVKAAKVKAASHDGSHAAPISGKLVTSIPLPEKGTLSAHDYIVAQRKATDRNSKIRNIAAFCGFDNRQDFGSQELAATMQANRQLRGAPKALAFPVHSVQPTIAGYVAGSRDEVAKRKEDLRGRTVYTTERMLDFQRQAREALAAGDMTNAHYAGSMAKVEEERLSQIHSDLASL